MRNIKVKAPIIHMNLISQNSQLINKLYYKLLLPLFCNGEPLVLSLFLSTIKISGKGRNGLFVAAIT